MTRRKRFVIYKILHRRMTKATREAAHWRDRAFTAESTLDYVFNQDDYDDRDLPLYRRISNQRREINALSVRVRWLEGRRAEP